MAKKEPVYFADMTFWGKARSIIFTILALIAFGAFLFGGYFLAGRSSDDSRQQRQGESDYEYRQRIKSDDEELYRDCGFRPTC